MPLSSQFARIIELPGEPYEPEITMYNCLLHYIIPGSTPGNSRMRVKALRVPSMFPKCRCLSELHAILGYEWFFVQQHRHIASASFCKALEYGLSPDVAPSPTVLYMQEYEGNILECISRYGGDVPIARRAEWVGNKLLRQAADALDFLHKVGVIHGNFYFGNILIDDEGAAVVADAGIYTTITKYLVPDDVAMNHLRLPNSLSCKSAEMVLSKGSRWRDPVVSDDIFSFAVTAWTVFSGEEPFPMYEETLRTVLRISKGAHKDLQKVSGMSDNLWNLLSIILAQENPPSEWPSLTEIVPELNANEPRG